MGTGFDEQQLRMIATALDQQVCAASPFADAEQIPAAAVWVEPQLVAVVEYKEWTSAGRLRAPVWKGFAETPPEAVTWEEEGPADPP